MSTRIIPAAQSHRPRLEKLFLASRSVFHRTLGFAPTVRTAVNEDKIAVAKFVRGVRSEYGVLVPEHLEVDLNDIESSYDSRGGFLLIVEHRGRLIATFGFVPTTPGCGELKKLYVTKRFRGMGLGTQV